MAHEAWNSSGCANLTNVTKEMPRLLLNILAVTSFLLCGATIVLCLRSYYRDDFLLIHRNFHVSIVSKKGNLHWTWAHYRLGYGRNFVELESLGGNTPATFTAEMRWVMAHGDDPLAYGADSTPT